MVADLARESNLKSRFQMARVVAATAQIKNKIIERVRTDPRRTYLFIFFSTREQTFSSPGGEDRTGSGINFIEVDVWNGVAIDHSMPISQREVALGSSSI